MSDPRPSLKNRSNRTKQNASLVVAMFCVGCMFTFITTIANPAQDKTGSLSVWRRLGPDQGINALEIDPTNPNTIYAASGQQLFKTTDGGVSWNKKGLS